jgi:cytochrome c oxidase assembly protein subunit 15
MGVGAVALWFFARRRGGADGQLMAALTAVCVLLALQGVVGLVQYHSHLPAAVVWMHASLAAVLWLALVAAWLTAGRVSRTA